MTEVEWDVQELSAGDWELVRSARLEALGESPEAFVAHRDHEEWWGEWEWRRTFEGAKWLAVRASETIGILRSVHDPTAPNARHIESIWVAPTHRKRGVFRDMLHRLIELERENGARDLMLWVLEDNHDAQDAYKRLGFVLTGQRQALLSEADRFERRLRLRLTEPLSA